MTGDDRESRRLLTHAEAVVLLESYKAAREVAEHALKEMRRILDEQAPELLARLREDEDR